MVKLGFKLAYQLNDITSCTLIGISNVSHVSTLRTFDVILLSMWDENVLLTRSGMNPLIIITFYLWDEMPK